MMSRRPVSWGVALVAMLPVFTEATRAQISSPDDLDQARKLAEAAKVPLATVLSDLVTKLTDTNIRSGLNRPVIDIFPGGIPATAKISNVDKQTRASTDAIVAMSNRRSEYLDTSLSLDSVAVKRAMDRGYTPRPVEFDNRFQNNLEQIVRLPKSEANARVWNGVQIAADADAFVDSVAIVGNSKICTGTLVKSDLVVTAAHCFCDGVMKEVLVGQNILTPADRIPVKVDESASFLRCADLETKNAETIAKGDVAILKLQRPATVPPRSIGDLKTVRNSAAVRAVGFGRTETNVIGFKYQIDLVIASFQCDGTALTGIPDHQIYRCQPSHELVAAGLNRDTCGGDSGGPIYSFGPDAKPHLVGVTSRAVDPLGRCGPGGIYVLLDAPPVRSWLVQRGVPLQ